VLRAALSDSAGYVTARRGPGHRVRCREGGRIATVAQVRDVEGARACFDSSRLRVWRRRQSDTVINQIEGATVMALGGALFEAIRFREGDHERIL